MIDRSLRPFFKHGFMNETQLVCNLMAVDGVHDADVLSINSAAAALISSGLPWSGPVAAVRVGLLPDNSIIINPTRREKMLSKLDLVVAGTSQKNIIMMEGSASEPILQDNLLAAIKSATKEIYTINKGLEALKNSLDVTAKKVEKFFAADQTLLDKTKE